MSFSYLDVHFCDSFKIAFLSFYVAQVQSLWEVIYYKADCSTGPAEFHKFFPPKLLFLMVWNIKKTIK